MIQIIRHVQTPIRRKNRMHPEQIPRADWMVTYEHQGWRCVWVGPWDLMPAAIRKAVQEENRKAQEEYERSPKLREPRHLPILSATDA